jgi:hypothetical protein
MRAYSADVVDLVAPADTRLITLMAAGVAQAFDWPAGAKVVRFSGQTTGGGPFGYVLNLTSTGANLPAGASSFTTGSTGGTLIRPAESKEWQIAGSTGFSVISNGAGYVGVEVWSK